MSVTYPTYLPSPYADENFYRTLPPRIVSLPTFEQVKSLLPQPQWDGHPSAIDCYWKAWELAFRNLRNPSDSNGFVSPFIDTAFNGNLFMWDSTFILMFARYGRSAFDFQQTLDNFYAKQHPDGFICRELRESDGSDAFLRFDPPATGPDVMPWSEWEYYLNFGDLERLGRVFPPLLAYHQWYRRYRTWQDGTYWACGWACGMDNQPRLRHNLQADDPYKYPLEWWDNDHMVWIDACLQAIFSARTLVNMAQALGRHEEVQDLHDEIQSLSQVVNSSLWDERTGFLYDRRSDGQLSQVKTIGAFWALLAGVLPLDRLEQMIAHLQNSAEFNRPHRVPSLSADHPEYHPQGLYWRGGVWPPTNYMILRGLTQAGHNTLAHEIGLNHHTNVVKVYEDTGTLWEDYAPESIEQGNIARPDFVGWTGLPPVAVLFEYLFGLRPNVPEHKLVWDVRLLEAHGVQQYPFGKQGLLDLHCQPRTDPHQKPVITVKSNLPVKIELIWEDSREIQEFF